MTENAPTHAGRELYRLAGEWFAPIVTLDSAAIALVVAFVDPTKDRAAPWLAALALILLAVSVIAGVVARFPLLARAMDDDDFEISTRWVAFGAGMWLLNLVCFAAGYLFLALFGAVNLLA